MPVIKNKPVGTHAIDYLLTCGCVEVEPVEAAIDVPQVNEERKCKKHGDQRIKKLGSIYWLDADTN